MNKTTKIIVGIVIIGVVVFIGYAVYKNQNKQVSGETIKIGAILPITGTIALSGGEQCREGIMMAVRDINNSGGIKNKQVELKIDDSQSNNKNGASAFSNLIGTYNPLVTISMGSALSKTLSPMAEQNKISLLATITSDPELTKNNNFTFRYYPTAEQEIPAIVKIAKDKNIQKFAVLMLNDDFGQAMLSTLKNNFKGDVVSEIFNISDTDFKTQLTKIKSENPDGLLIVGFSSHMITAVKQAKELKINSTLFLSSAAVIPSVRKGLNDIGVNVFAPAPIVYKNILNSDIAALKDKFNKFEKDKTSKIEFDHYVVACYDTVKILEKVLKNNQITKEGVENGLINLKNFSGLLGDISIKGREFNFPLYPVEITNGELVFIQ